MHMFLIRPLAAALLLGAVGISAAGCVSTSDPVPTVAGDVQFVQNTDGFMTQGIVAVNDHRCVFVPGRAERDPVEPKSVRLIRHARWDCGGARYVLNSGSQTGYINGLVAPVAAAAAFGGTSIIAARMTPGITNINQNANSNSNRLISRPVQINRQCVGAGC